jgi:GT2 family glycosyltransferase
MPGYDLPLVGINFLCCNREPLHHRATEFALRSLRESDLAEHEWRMVAVDNGSTCPETPGLLQGFAVASGGRTEVIALGENAGIPVARNRASERLLDLGCEVVVEVHNDHLFPRHWLRAMLQALEAQPRCGILGPGLITERGYFGSPVLGPGHGYEAGYEAMRARVHALNMQLGHNPVLRVGLQHPAVNRAEMLREIGLYDERFPAKTNFEDTELCYRAHLAGWQVMVFLGVWVYHHYHLSRLQLTDQYADFAANKAYFDAKHPDWFPWNVEFSRAMGQLYGPGRAYHRTGHR